MTEIPDDLEIDSLLQRNVPHSADVIVQTIGNMGRQLRHSLLDKKSDFPLPVTVETIDGRRISTTLESLYADGSSQADGTFYFAEPVRQDDRPNRNFLLGKEIKTITILSQDPKARCTGKEP